MKSSNKVFALISLTSVYSKCIIQAHYKSWQYSVSGECRALRSKSGRRFCYPRMNKYTIRTKYTVRGQERRVNRIILNEMLANHEIKQIGPKEYEYVRHVEIGGPSLRVRTSGETFSAATVSPGNWFNSLLRRSRNENAPGIHSAKKWMDRVEYFGWRCRYCKEPLTSKTLTKDHQIPLSRHGSNWPANLVPACGSCNGMKHNRKPSEWRVIAS